MPPGAPPQQNDNSLGPLWIMLGICVVCGAIWYFAHAYIVLVVFKLKSAEIAVISLFTDKLDNIDQIIKSLPPADVTFSQLSYVSSEVGRYIRIPCAIILLVFAVMIYRSGSAGSYTQAYSMQSMLSCEQKNWYQIQPIVGLDLIDTHVDKGKWAMSLTAMDFAKKHKLIIEELAPRDEGELKRDRQVLAKLDRGRAAAVFTLQLGPLWQGVDKLNPQTKALFTVFAARANGDRKLADRLLEQMARSFDHKKNTVDYSGIDEHAKKYENNEIVKRAINSHAYVYTVLPAMLQAARYDGVFAAVDFLWLKPIDRQLWFVLNTVGRQVPVAEVAAPFAHGQVEERLGRKVFVPMIDAAVDALEVAMGEIIYQPDGGKGK